MEEEATSIFATENSAACGSLSWTTRRWRCDAAYPTTAARTVTRSSSVQQYPSDRPELELVLMIDEEQDRRQISGPCLKGQARQVVSRKHGRAPKAVQGPPCGNNNVMPACSRRSRPERPTGMLRPLRQVFGP